MGFGISGFGFRVSGLEDRDNVKYLTALEKYTECLYTSGGPPAAMDVLPALVNKPYTLIPTR